MDEKPPRTTTTTKHEESLDLESTRSFMLRSNMDEKTYTIKQTALITGLSEDTLRYYERIGLVGPIGRAPSGHRRYTAFDHQWVDFLAKMLGTGMSLQTLGRYIDLFREGEDTAPERRALLEVHARQLEGRISQLQETLSFLQWKIDHYDDLMRAKERQLRSHPSNRTVRRSPATPSGPEVSRAPPRAKQRA